MLVQLPRKKILKIFTLTGHSINNPIKKLGDINLQINSKAYNHIENVHQFWLTKGLNLSWLNIIIDLVFMWNKE